MLRHTHFSFVRFVLEGLGPPDAWLRCLAFAGGLDDERHIDKRLREICDQIRLGAVRAAKFGQPHQLARRASIYKLGFDDESHGNPAVSLQSELS